MGVLRIHHPDFFAGQDEETREFFVAFFNASNAVK